MHDKQLTTFDHPYHIHKYLDSVNLQPSCWLIGTLFSIKHMQLHMIMIYTGALSGQRPDINNGPGVTRIVPTFGPSIYSNSTRIMALPRAIPVFAQMEDTPVKVSHLWSGGCHI